MNANTKKENYWGENEDKLFVNYLTAQTESNYIKLRPVLLRVYSHVLTRYYSSFLQHLDGVDMSVEDAVTECEVNLITSLLKFKNERGKAYSFVGTCARNFYHNLFRKIVNNNMITNIYDENNEVQHDVPDKDNQDANDELFDMAMKKLEGLQKTDLTPDKRLVVDLIIHYLNTFEVLNKRDLTDYLLLNTGFTPMKLKAILLTHLNIRVYSKAKTKEVNYFKPKKSLSLKQIPNQLDRIEIIKNNFNNRKRNERTRESIK